MLCDTDEAFVGLRLLADFIFVFVEAVAVAGAPPFIATVLLVPNLVIPRTTPGSRNDVPIILLPDVPKLLEPETVLGSLNVAPIFTDLVVPKLLTPATIPGSVNPPPDLIDLVVPKEAL